MTKKVIYNKNPDIFLKRRNHSKRRFYRWAGGLLLVGGSLIGLVYVLLYASFLKVKTIQISSDLTSLDPDLVTASLSAQMIGQSRLLAMLGADNILFWWLGKKPTQLETIPALADVSVATNLFRREVDIKPAERVLSGILCLPTNDCYGFDGSGVVFSKMPQSQGSLILRIDDQNQRNVSLGSKILPNDQWVNNIFQTLKVLAANNVSIASVGIRPLDLKEWQVDLVAGPIFYFSLNFMPDNLDGILQNLLKRLDLSKLQYLDFRVENRIYYK